MVDVKGLVHVVLTARDLVHVAWTVEDLVHVAGTAGDHDLEAKIADERHNVLVAGIIVRGEAIHRAVAVQEAEAVAVIDAIKQAIAAPVHDHPIIDGDAGPHTAAVEAVQETATLTVATVVVIEGVAIGMKIEKVLHISQNNMEGRVSPLLHPALWVEVSLLLLFVQLHLLLYVQYLHPLLFVQLHPL